MGAWAIPRAPYVHSVSAVRQAWADYLVDADGQLLLGPAVLNPDIGAVLASLFVCAEPVPVEAQVLGVKLLFSKNVQRADLIGGGGGWELRLYGVEEDTLGRGWHRDGEALGDSGFKVGQRVMWFDEGKGLMRAVTVVQMLEGQLLQVVDDEGMTSLCFADDLQPTGHGGLIPTLPAKTSRLVMKSKHPLPDLDVSRTDEPLFVELEAPLAVERGVYLGLVNTVGSRLGLAWNRDWLATDRVKHSWYFNSSQDANEAGAAQHRVRRSVSRPALTFVLRPREPLGNDEESVAVDCRSMVRQVLESLLGFRVSEGESTAVVQAPATAAAASPELQQAVLDALTAGIRSLCVILEYSVC